MSEYKKFNEIKVTFENGDILVLVFSNCHFGTYEPAMVYQLSYGERLENRRGEAISIKDDGYYFNMCRTEYFPENMRNLALQAFNIRLNSNNPANESDQGLYLDSFLVKEDNKDIKYFVSGNKDQIDKYTDFNIFNFYIKDTNIPNRVFTDFDNKEEAEVLFNRMCDLGIVAFKNWI